MGIILKPTRTGDMAADGCAKSFSVANVPMVMTHHRSFTGFGLDRSCVADSMRLLVITYALQLLNPNSKKIAYSGEATEQHPGM